MSYDEYDQYFATLQDRVDALCMATDRAMIWEHLRKGRLPPTFTALIAACPNVRERELIDADTLVRQYITAYVARTRRREMAS